MPGSELDNRSTLFILQITCKAHTYSMRPTVQLHIGSSLREFHHLLAELSRLTSVQIAGGLIVWKRNSYGQINGWSSGLASACVNRDTGWCLNTATVDDVKGANNRVRKQVTLASSDSDLWKQLRLNLMVQLQGSSLAGWTGVPRRRPEIRLLAKRIFH
ncbi:unnamed protein product [Protopolystoma xenopodis]|uniref:Uncharacterized protein n=1 Tax=Protopolystoma xenopodis TaxID=117903 RepID=A0A3S4ZDY7_9PLAT|nr:unnamed protein product [Protopolystoma xenopodis]